LTPWRQYVRAGLVKGFETTCAVDGVDLVVAPGAVRNAAKFPSCYPLRPEKRLTGAYLAEVICTGCGLLRFAPQDAARGNRA
jgi:hypothetical protein